MGESVLPKLSATGITDQLPTDPAELLSETEQRDLARDLATLAELRREAEADSASLRLA